MNQRFRYKTPEGFDDLLLFCDGEVLTGLVFEGMPVEKVSAMCDRPSVILDTFRWLDVYFSGRQPDFTPAYRMEHLTPFRKAVVEVMLGIPFGRTMTYGEIAQRVGVRSAQAVGGAVGWNPICLIVPCHRVIGADGGLTGYSSGLHNKVALLQHEGYVGVA
jgi:methylated-DNA-[protein]-cysteine S-methyltransferase